MSGTRTAPAGAGRRGDAQPPTCDAAVDPQGRVGVPGRPVGTLYQWRVRGEGPPAFKIGRHVRFDPDRVRAWLADSAA